MMRGGQNVSDAQLQQILADVPKIINDPQATELLILQAQKLGKRLAEEEVGMTQLRDVFDELSLIADLLTWKRQPILAFRRLHLLKPKLLWRATRKKELKPLARVLEKAIDEVVKAGDEGERRARFGRLREFMEAIVAYHKFYGGGD
jgi:CRISPR-associated protein Csm2